VVVTIQISYGFIIVALNATRLYRLVDHSRQKIEEISSPQNLKEISSVLRRLKSLIITSWVLLIFLPGLLLYGVSTYTRAALEGYVWPETMDVCNVPNVIVGLISLSAVCGLSYVHWAPLSFQSSQLASRTHSKPESQVHSNQHTMQSSQHTMQSSQHTAMQSSQHHVHGDQEVSNVTAIYIDHESQTV